jgi:hypothetical protein
LNQPFDLSIGRLAGLGTFDPRGAILTAHMTWPLKMDVLEALATTLEADYPSLAGIKDAKPLLKKAQEVRNFIAHGHWVAQDGKVYRLRTTARGKLRADLSPVAPCEDRDGDGGYWRCGSGAPQSGIQRLAPAPRPRHLTMISKPERLPSLQSHLERRPVGCYLPFAPTTLK